jgi:hypothetical protein
MCADARARVCAFCAVALQAAVNDVKAKRAAAAAAAAPKMATA